MTRPDRIKMLIEICAKLGVTKKDICKKFGVEKAEDIHNGQIKDLGKFIGEISSGKKKPRDVFPRK